MRILGVVLFCIPFVIVVRYSITDLGWRQAMITWAISVAVVACFVVGAWLILRG
jgi:hypothetical protein